MAAKIQIAAATCRTKAISRAGVRESRHETNQALPNPGDIPVGLDPQLSMSKKNNGRNPAVNTAETELRCRTPWLNYSSVFAERNFIATISSATTTP